MTIQNENSLQDTNVFPAQMKESDILLCGMRHWTQSKTNYSNKCKTIPWDAGTIDWKQHYLEVFLETACSHIPLTKTPGNGSELEMNTYVSGLTSPLVWLHMSHKGIRARVTRLPSSVGIWFWRVITDETAHLGYNVHLNALTVL